MFRYRAFDFSSSLFRVAYCIAQRPCPSPQIDRAKARQALRTAPRRAVGRELFLNGSLPAVSLLDWVLTGCDGKRDGAGHGAHDAAFSTSRLLHNTSPNRFLFRLRRACQQIMDGADSKLAENPGIAKGCQTNTANAEHHGYSSAMPASSFLYPP